ncbi:MAG: helix-turn-helix domain-containing protein, partial [Actinomycetota bacterium]
MSGIPTNRVKVLRTERNWSQQDLASASHLSRAEISAIETNRLVPSVTAALRLSEAFGCAVEELFSLPRPGGDRQRWAGNHPGRTRFWRSQFGDATVLYPTEATPVGTLPHDGVANDDRLEIVNDTSPSETLVVSGCDPAVGLLAAEYSRQTGFRLLPLGRGSRKGLDLLEDNVVHIAGLHLTDEHGRPDNERPVRERL